MIRHSFDFGSSTLSVTSPKKIKPELLDSTYKMLEYVKYDFNHKIHNSSAYRLNDTPAQVPCPISKEFGYYLKLNIDLADETGGKFMPFAKKEGEIGDAINKIIWIENDTAYESEKIIFDSEVLIQPFVIDTIYDQLVEKGVKDFLISTNNYHRADNGREWKVELEVENEQFLETTIRNSTVGLNFNRRYKDTKLSTSRFAAKDEVIQYKFAIVNSKTCIENKVIGFELMHISMDSEYRKYAHDNNINFRLIDLNDHIRPYSPLGF